MAQLLHQRDATHKHLGATRRHMRLCRQYPGTRFLVDQIQLPYNVLKDKRAATLKKREQREDRCDNLIIIDTLLDDRVRLTFRRCEEYDRFTPADPVLHRIFPEGKFGHIVNMSLRKEPDAVEQLAMRVEDLGKGHALYPLAKELRTQVAASRRAIGAYREMVKQVKTSEADEKIAQATLRRQYENNYLDARKQLGKMRAERLFPKLNSPPRPVQSVEENLVTEVAPARSR